MKHTAIMILLWAFSPAASQQPEIVDNTIRFDASAVFDEVATMVEQHFYRPGFEVQDWRRTAAPFRDRCMAATTHDEFAKAINDLLNTLNASHTYYFSKLNPKRYQILGVFNQLFPDRGPEFFQYSGIGIDTTEVDGSVYITSVYDGFSADQSGLQYGDQIVLADDRPFHPILSFTSANRRCQLTIRRNGQEQKLSIPVGQLDGRNMFIQAMEASGSVFQCNGKSIGYIHVWNYAGTVYQDTLRDQILWGKLKHCDALVVDLRDGWGGADINYLNLFRPAIAKVESTSRSGDRQSYSGVWQKPVALLVNQRTTSGKELFAYGFKKLNLGRIIGQTTAGAVVGGRCFLLSNDDVLYLAVRDVRVDGQRLEQVGVQPDIKVTRPLTDASAGDPQLERALELLSR